MGQYSDVPDGYKVLPADAPPPTAYSDVPDGYKVLGATPAPAAPPISAPTDMSKVPGAVPGTPAPGQAVSAPGPGLPPAPASPSNYQAAPNQQTPEERLGTMVPNAAVPALAATEKALTYIPQKVAPIGAAAGEGLLKLPLAAGGSHIAQPVPEQPSPETTGAARGIGEVAATTIADPLNWPFFGAGEARPLLQRVISLGFTGMLSKNALDAATDLHDNWDKYTPEERTERASKASLSALLAGAGAFHAVNPRLAIHSTPEETRVGVAANPLGMGPVGVEARFPKGGYEPPPSGTGAVEAPTIEGNAQPKYADVPAGYKVIPPEEKPVHHATNDVEDLRASAERQAPKIGDAVADATKGVEGAKVEAVRDSKDTDRIEDKAERQNVQPSQIADIAAAKVTVPDQKSAEKVLDNLHKDMPVETAEGAVHGEPGKNGVRQVQAIVDTKAGADEAVKKAEILIQTPEMHAATEKTHDDYRRAQELRAAGKDAEAEKLEAKIIETHNAAEKARSGSDAVSEVGKSVEPESGTFFGARAARDLPGVDDRSKYQRTFPEYKPHATVGYVKPEAASKVAQAPAPLQQATKEGSLKDQKVEVRNAAGEWKPGTVAFDGSGRVGEDSGKFRRVRGVYDDGSKFDNVKVTDVRKPEVGVDFDGTLFKENKDGSIGEPIPERIASLKKDIADGKNVVIESHRARHPGGADAIHAALEAAGLPRLPVSAKKNLAPTLIDDVAQGQKGVKEDQVKTDANTPLPDVAGTHTAEGAKEDNNTLAKVKADHPEWSLSQQLQEAAKQANVARGKPETGDKVQAPKPLEKKPVTPQVPALSGSTPLGAKPKPTAPFHVKQTGNEAHPGWSLVDKEGYQWGTFSSYEKANTALAKAEKDYPAPREKHPMSTLWKNQAEPGALQTYEAELSRFAGDPQPAKKVRVEAENRRHAEQLLKGKYPDGKLTDAYRVEAITNKQKFEDVYRKHLEAAVEKKPGDYMYPKSQAAAVAKKMTDSLSRGAASKDSPAVRATLKELGIKDTFTDIRRYLTEPVDKGSKIEAGKSDVPQNESARPAEHSKDVPVVSGSPSKGGDSSTPVSSEGKRTNAEGRDTPPDARQSDGERLERNEGQPSERSQPERSGGSGTPAHTGEVGETGRGSEEGSRGADGRRLESPTPQEPEEAQATAAKLRNERNFHISDEYAKEIGSGGEISKIKGNLDALETLKKIQSEGRELATPEEQDKLSKYVDFGGLVGMLQRYWEPQYKAHYERFTKLLSPAEIQEIRETLPNTHYTSMQVVDWMWDAMKRMGFRGGRVLEPGMGIGNFMGRMPEKMAGKSELFGVERNPLTGAMAKLLYPDANIQVKPFQKFLVPNNSLDAVIGNVPFQDVTITDDPPYKNLKLNLHNYFIVKALDKLKPGGIAALITSRYTMDNSKTTGHIAREEMAKRADLIAAIRLPDAAFKRSAGTEVVADLLVFQKRDPAAEPGNTNWTKLSPIKVGDKEFMVNSYFVDNPDHVLGEHSSAGSMYGPGQYTVKNPGDFAKSLEDAATLFPKNRYGKVKDAVDRTPAPSTLEPSDLKFAPEDVKPGAYFRNDKGEIQIKQSGVGIDLPESQRSPEKLAHIGRAIDLRDQLNHTIQSQLRTSDDGELKAEQKKLEKLYDAYHKDYGYLHGPKLQKLFGDDPEYPKLLALENVDTENHNVTKAAIFSKRVLAPYEPLRDLPDDPKSAMLKVMAERGYLDTKLMADLLKKPEGDVVSDLTKADLIYQDPASGHYHTADEYLSGNVREKLRQAEDAVASDKAFERNVEALKKAQPTPLTIHEIQPVLGQTWIPMDVYKGFVAHLAKGRAKDVDISRDASGKWNVQVDGNKFELDHQWAGGGLSGHKLVQYAMNQQQPTVWVKNEDGSRSINQQATTAAREKLTVIKEEFKTALRNARPEVTNKLEELYNNTFNAVKLREFSGEHLDFPGMSQEWKDKIRGYQKAAVWRILQEGRGGVFHAPGLGKTLTMVTAGMEARRLKLSRKNMYAVPNNMVPQWREDFKRFYPNANVLAVTDEDFTATNRAKLMSRIATGDWDAVIIPHSQFDLLPMSPEHEVNTINKRITDYRRVLEELAKNDDKRTIKQIEKAVDKLESRLKELNDKKKDNTIPFDQLGADMLFVDEAHAYKAMSVPSKMGNIGGLSNRASQRAFALEMKADYLRDTHKGRGLVFGTGTPITNTVGELYVMTKYLAPEILEAAGIRSFDDWAANFATTRTNWEYGADGVSFKPKTSLSSFINVPELQTMFQRFAEYLSKDAARKLSNLKEPNAKRNDRMVTVTPSQEPLLEEIANRGEKLLKHPPRTPEEQAEDNWLKLSGDARKMSLDPRLYDPDLNDDADSKANTAVGDIKEVLDNSKDDKGTVVVFSDFFQHKGADGKPDFNIFEDMKKKLVKKGVPADQIAVVHEAADKEAQATLFAKVRSGKVRVIFGSTEKLGVGVNIQDRLKALLHLDQPWRPDQVEQREGRIIRSGNMWDDVQIFRYISEPIEGMIRRYDEHAKVPAAVILKKGEHPGTSYRTVRLADGTRVARHKSFDVTDEQLQKLADAGRLTEATSIDAFGGDIDKPRPRAYDLQMYQQLAKKAEWQEQILSGTFKGRTIDDIGGDVKLNSQMFQLGKAMATGNPDALLKVKLEHDLITYSMLERNFQTEQSRNYRTQQSAKFRIPVIEKQIKLLSRDAETWAKAEKAENVGLAVGDTLREGDELRDWLKTDPSIADLEGKPLKIGGVDTEIISRPGPGDDGVRYEYRLAGDTHAVPYDSEKGVSHVRAFINSFAARARGLDSLVENAKGDLERSKETLANITEELKKKSPYADKVEKWEKQIQDINKRLGMVPEADEVAPQDDEEEPPEPKKRDGERGSASLSATPLGMVAEAAITAGKYVQEIAHATELARDLARGLATLNTAAEADILRGKETFEELKKNGLTKADDESIYHYMEDPENAPLDYGKRQQAFYQKVAEPIAKQNTAMYKELSDGGVPIENYVSRSVKGKAGMLDRIAQKIRGVGKKGTLSKAAPQLKHRTLMGIESPSGERRVISIKDGKATMWEKGESTDLGEIKNAAGQSSAENETWPDGEPNSAFFEKGKIVEGPDGYDWKITQATTKEIEANTGVEYYHSAFASLLASSIQLTRAVRALRFLNAFKASPEFKEIAWNGGGNPPAGWKTTTLPQFRGTYFEPRTAEVLDDYAERLSGGSFGVLQQVQGFLRAAYLINPIMHPLNVAASWTFEKGLSGLMPWKYKTIATTGSKAIKAVLKQNDDFKAALDAGAALQSHRSDLQNINKLFFERLSDGLEKKESWAVRVAQSLGIEHGNLLNLLHKPSSIAAWVSSDVMYLQAAYQYQAEHSGVALKDALEEVGRIIPEYRVPSRIMDSRLAAKAMTNPLISWFGAYHYGLLKSYAESMKSAVGAQEPAPGRTKAEEVGKGWDRLAMLGLITLVAFPYIFDKLAKKVAGDEHARFRRPGAFGYLDSAINVAEHKESPATAIQKVVTPSPIPKSAAELAFNREFYSGHAIYDPHANWKTETEQIGHYLLGSVGPGGRYSQHAETSEQKHKFWLQQMGIQMAKTRAEKTALDIAMSKVGTEAENPEDHANRVQRREILDQMRLGNRKPFEDARQKHELTHRQILEMDRRAKLSPLEDITHNFTIAETQKVLDAAKADNDPKEIQQLQHVLRLKRARARDFYIGSQK